MELSEIFENYSEPIIGTCERKVVFVNAAARSMFGENFEIILPYVFPRDNSAFNARISGTEYPALRSFFEGFDIITVLSRPPINDAAFPAVISSMEAALRNELSSIGLAVSLSFSQIDIPHESPLEKHLSMINQSYHRLLRLSNNMALYKSSLSSSNAALNLKTVNLVEFFAHLTELSASALTARELTFECELSSLLSSIDTQKFKILFYNLVSNAVKNTSENGKIKIKLEKANNHFLLSVSDNGRGIAPDILPYLFNTFENQRINDITKGSGLGMSVVHHIVTSHGGSIVAFSEIGNTEIRLSVPISGGFILSRPPAVNSYANSDTFDVLTGLSDVLPYTAFSRLFSD